MSAAAVPQGRSRIPRPSSQGWEKSQVEGIRPNTTHHQTTPAIKQLQDEITQLKRKLEGETSQLKHLKHERVREVQRAREGERGKWKNSLAVQKYRLHQEKDREMETLRVQLSKHHAAEINKILKEREEFSKASRDADRERASFTQRLREQILAEAKEEAKKSVVAERNRFLQEIEELKSSRKQLEDELSQSESAIRHSSEDLRWLTESHERDVESLKKDARKDIIILIDGIKAKDRIILELEKELGHQAGYAQKMAAERDTTREELNLSKLRDVWEKRDRSPDKNNSRKVSSNNSTSSESKRSKKFHNSSEEPDTSNKTESTSCTSQTLPKMGPKLPNKSISRETLSSKGSRMPVRGSPIPSRGSPIPSKGSPMSTMGSSLPLRSPMPKSHVRRTLPSGGSVTGRVTPSPSRNQLHKPEQARLTLERRCRALEEELGKLRREAKTNKRPKSPWTTENMDLVRKPRGFSRPSHEEGDRSRGDGDTGVSHSGNRASTPKEGEMEEEIGRLRRQLDEQFEEIVELKESAKADRKHHTFSRRRDSLPSETQSEYDVSLNSSLAFSEDMDNLENFRRALSQADAESRESLSRLTPCSVFMGDHGDMGGLRTQIQEMESSQEKLLAELHSSKEQNELLEFQLLEASEEPHLPPESSHPLTEVLANIFKYVQEHKEKFDLSEIKQRVDQITSEKDGQLTDADKESVGNLRAFLELVEVELLKLHGNKSDLQRQVDAQVKEADTLREEMNLLLQKLGEKDEIILSTNKQLDELLENEFDLVEKLRQFENQVAILEEELLELRETDATTLKSLVGPFECEDPIISTRGTVEDAPTEVRMDNEEKGVQVFPEDTQIRKKMSDKGSHGGLSAHEEDVVFSDDDSIGDLLPDAEITESNSVSEECDSRKEPGHSQGIPSFLMTGDKNETQRSDEGELENVATVERTPEISKPPGGKDSLHVSRGDRRERSGSFVQELADETCDPIKLGETLLEGEDEKSQLEFAVDEATRVNSLLATKVSELKENERKMSQVISDQMIAIQDLKRETGRNISKEVFNEHEKELRDKIRQLEGRESHSDFNIQQEIMEKMAVLESERVIMEDTLRLAEVEKRGLRDALDREKISRMGDDKLQIKIAQVETNESQLRDLEEKHGEIQQLVEGLEIKQQDMEKDLERLGEEKCELEAKISDLDQRKNAQEEDISRQQNKLEKLSQEEEQLQGLVQELERKVESVADTKEKQSQTETGDSSVNQIVEVESLTGEIDRLKEENNLLQELQDQCDAKDNLLKRLETEKVELQECLNEVESANNIMDRDLEEKVKEKNQLAGELTEASKRISDMECTVAELQRSIAEKESCVIDKGNEEKQEKMKLQEKLEQLRMQLKTVEEANVTLTVKLEHGSSVREENNFLLTEISSLEENLHEVSMQKDKLHKELKNKEVECSRTEELKEAVRDHKLTLTRKSEEIQDLEGKLRERETEFEQDRQELVRKIKLLESESETLKGQNENLQQDLGRSRDDEKVLEDKLEDMDGIIGMYEEYDKLKSDLEDMLRCKEELEESKASLEKEFCHLGEKCESLTEENRKLSHQIEQIPCEEKAHQMGGPSDSVPSDDRGDRSDLKTRLEQLTDIKESLGEELKEKEAEIENLRVKVIDFEQTQSKLLDRDAGIEKLVAEIENRQMKERELEEKVNTQKNSLGALTREVEQAEAKIARCEEREGEMLHDLMEKDTQLKTLHVKEMELQEKLKHLLSESLCTKGQQDVTESIPGLEARKVRIGALEDELQQLQFGGSDMFGSSDDDSAEEEHVGGGRDWTSSSIAPRLQTGVTPEDEDGLYSIVEQEVWEEVEVRQTTRTFKTPPGTQEFGSQGLDYAPDNDREDYNRMLNEQIERLEAEVKSQKKMLEEEILAKEKLQDEILMMLQSESDLKEQLSTLLEQNEGLQENMRCLKEVESEIDSLKTFVGKLTDEKKDLQMRLEDAEIFQEGNSEKLQEKEREFDRMKEEVDKMEGEREKLMDRVREMESNMKDVADDLEMGASLDLLGSGQMVDLSEVRGSLKMEESLREEIKKLEDKNSVLEEQLGDRTRISLDTSELDSLFFSSDEESEPEEQTEETMDEKVRRLEKLNHSLKSQVKHLLTLQEFEDDVEKPNSLLERSEDQDQSDSEGRPVEEQLEMVEFSNNDLKKQLAISEENSRYLEQQLEDLRRLMQDGGFENQESLIEKVEVLEKSQKRLCEEIETLKRDLAEKKEELESTRSELLNTENKFSLRIGELEESELRLLENLDANNERWKSEAECSMERIEELESVKGDLREQLSHAEEQLEELLASQSFGNLSNTCQSGLSLLDEGLGALDIGRTSFDEDELEEENAGIHREMEDALRSMENEDEASVDWMVESERLNHRIDELEKSEVELMEKVNALEEKEKGMSELCEELKKDLQDRITEINDLKEALKSAEEQVEKFTGNSEVDRGALVAEISHLQEQIVFMKEGREELLAKIQEFSRMEKDHQDKASPERGRKSFRYRSECEIGILQCRSSMMRQFRDIEKPARACSILKMPYWGMEANGECGTAKPEQTQSVSPEQEMADSTDTNSESNREVLDRVLYCVEERRPKVWEVNFEETILVPVDGITRGKLSDKFEPVEGSAEQSSDSLVGTPWFQSLTDRGPGVACLNFDEVLHSSLDEPPVEDGDALFEGMEKGVIHCMEPICSQEEVTPVEATQDLFTRLSDDRSQSLEAKLVSASMDLQGCQVCDHLSKRPPDLKQNGIDITTELEMMQADHAAGSIRGRAEPAQGETEEGHLHKKIKELEQNEVALKERIDELEGRWSDFEPGDSLSYVQSLCSTEVVCRNVDEVILAQHMQGSDLNEEEGMHDKGSGSSADHCVEHIFAHEEIYPLEVSPDLFAHLDDSNLTGQEKDSLDAGNVPSSEETNDARLRERIQELEQNEVALNDQITELETVQSAFEETLSQADAIMKDREAEYVGRIRELEALQSDWMNEQAGEREQKEKTCDGSESEEGLDGGLQELKDRIRELEDSEVEYTSRIQELEALGSNWIDSRDEEKDQRGKTCDGSDMEEGLDGGLQRLKDRIEELEDSELKLMDELEGSLENEEKLREEITRVAAVLCDVEEDVATRDGPDDVAVSLESRATLLREQNQSLVLELDEEGRELQGLKEEIGSLQGDRTQLEEEVASIQKERQKLESEVESIREDRRQLEGQLEAIHSDYAMKDKQISQMSEDLSAKEVLERELTEKVESLENYSETLRSKLESANQNVEETGREMEFLKRGREKTEKDCENLRRQLEAVEKSVIDKGSDPRGGPDNREEEIGKKLLDSDETVTGLQENLHLANIQIEDLKRGKIALEEQLKKLHQSMVSNNMVTLSEDEYHQLKSRPPPDGTPDAGQLDSTNDAEQFANAGKLWVKLDQTTKELRKYQELYNTTMKEVGHLKQALKDASDKHEAYLVNRVKSSAFTDTVHMTILDMEHKQVQTDPLRAITTDTLKLQLTAADGQSTTLQDLLEHHPGPRELDESSPHQYTTYPSSMVTAGQDMYLLECPPRVQLDTSPPMPKILHPGGLPTPTDESPELPPLPARPPPMELSFMMEEESILGRGMGEVGYEDAVVHHQGRDEASAAPEREGSVMSDLTESGCLRDLKMSEWSKVMGEAEEMKDKVRELEEKIREKDIQLHHLEQEKNELSLIAEVTKEGPQFQEKLAEKEAELADKRREITHLKGELKRREAEGTPLKLQFERLQNDYKDKEQSMRLLDAEQIRLKEKLAERERALFSKEREVEDLKKRIQSLQQGSESLPVEEDVGVGSNPVEKTGDEDLRGEKEYLLEQNERLRRQLDQLGPLQERMTSLEAELERGLRRGKGQDLGLSRKLQLAEKHLKQKAREELRLSEDNLLLQRQISRLEKERAHLDRLEAEYRDMKGKFNDLEYKKYEAELSVAPLKAKVSFLTKQFHKKDAHLRKMAADAAVKSPERASEIFSEIESLGHLLRSPINNSRLSTASPELVDSTSPGRYSFGNHSPVSLSEHRHEIGDDLRFDLEDDLEVSSGAMTLQDLIKEASRPTTGVHSRVGMSQDSRELSDMIHGRRRGVSDGRQDRTASSVDSDDTLRELLDGGGVDDFDLALRRSKAMDRQTARHGLKMRSGVSQPVVSGGINSSCLTEGRRIRYLTDDDKAGFDEAGSMVPSGQTAGGAVTSGQPHITLPFRPSEGQQAVGLYQGGSNVTQGNNSVLEFGANNPEIAVVTSGMNTAHGNRLLSNFGAHNPGIAPVTGVPVVGSSSHFGSLGHFESSSHLVHSSPASGPLNSLSSLQSAPHVVSSTDTVTMSPIPQRPFTRVCSPPTGIPDPPRALNVATTVSDWSVLLVWKTPLLDHRGCSNGHQVAGYRIYVDGRLKQFATSPHLTKALVTNVNLQTAQTFGVQTVSVEGKASFIREIQSTLPHQSVPHMTPDLSFSDSAREPSSVPSSPITGERPKQRLFMAVYSYNPAEHSPNPNYEGELSFREGDLIKVRGHVRSDGFYNGMVNGRKGLVPSNFIEEISISSLSKKKKKSKPHRLPENSVTRREDRSGFTQQQRAALRGSKV